MGRNKLEMKKIDKPAQLKSTFSKRRQGLFRKANELCKLCGAEITIITFSPTKVYTYPDDPASVNSNIERFFANDIASAPRVDLPDRKKVRDRRKNIVNKAKELSILCARDVLVFLSFPGLPNFPRESWPPNQSEVNRIIDMYYTRQAQAAVKFPSCTQKAAAKETSCTLDDGGGDNSAPDGSNEDGKTVSLSLSLSGEADQQEREDVDDVYNDEEDRDEVHDDGEDKFSWEEELMRRRGADQYVVSMLNEKKRRESLTKDLLSRLGV